MHETIESLRNEAAMGRMLLRGGIVQDQALKAIWLHHETMAGRHVGIVLKKSAKTNVTIVEWDGTLGARRLCVKEFRRPRLLRFLPGAIRHRPVLASWHAALELERRGISAVRPLAAVLGRGLHGYLVMITLEAAELLAGYVRHALGRRIPQEQRNAFLHAGAKFLDSCWRAGVMHGDLKATNVFVRETGPDSWEFTLVDLAAVRFPRCIRLRNKLLNLAQLGASTPLALTWTDRLRFLRFLAHGDPALAERNSIARIARMMQARRCVWS